MSEMCQQSFYKWANLQISACDFCPHIRNIDFSQAIFPNLLFYTQNLVLKEV